MKHLKTTKDGIEFWMGSGDFPGFYQRDTDGTWWRALFRKDTSETPRGQELEDDRQEMIDNEAVSIYGTTMTRKNWEKLATALKHAAGNFTEADILRAVRDGGGSE